MGNKIDKILSDFGKSEQKDEDNTRILYKMIVHGENEGKLSDHKDKKAFIKEIIAHDLKTRNLKVNDHIMKTLIKNYMMVVNQYSLLNQQIIKT